MIVRTASPKLGADRVVVTCPRCGALPGERCRNLLRRGHPTMYLHPERRADGGGAGG